MQWQQSDEQQQFPVRTRNLHLIKYPNVKVQSYLQTFHDMLFHVAPDQYISTREPKLSSLNCSTGKDIPWLGCE